MFLNVNYNCYCGVVVLVTNHVIVITVNQLVFNDYAHYKVRGK